MKPIPCIIAAVMLITPAAQAMFGRVAAERSRRIYVEQKLTEQEYANNRLRIAISVLSAGVVISLIIGAAIGSKTRRDHEL